MMKCGSATAEACVLAAAEAVEMGDLVRIGSGEAAAEGMALPALPDTEVLDLGKPPRSEDTEADRGCAVLPPPSTCALFWRLGPFLIPALDTECLELDRPLGPRFSSVSASLELSTAASTGLSTFSVGCRFFPP